MASGNCVAGARKRAAQRAFLFEARLGFKNMLRGHIFYFSCFG